VRINPALKAAGSGEVEEGRRYTEDDFNRVIEIRARVTGTDGVLDEQDLRIFQ
jgi:hypothetical protein